jgi:hypothetical protein
VSKTDSKAETGWATHGHSLEVVIGLFKLVVEKEIRLTQLKVAQVELFDNVVAQHIG